MFTSTSRPEESFAQNSPVIPFGGTRNEVTTDFPQVQVEDLNSLRAQFGQRIRQIRDEMEKSQEEFAEMVGMSVDFLSLIERGRNAPSFKKLELMMKGLGVSAAYLFTFENPPSKKSRKSRIRH